MTHPPSMETLTALAAEVGLRLQAKGWFLATAESCTGGLIGHTITNIAGSSAYFLGGIIAYANEAKRQLLGVPEALLATHGAVSCEVALAMAQGARRTLGADVAISATGIAGPSGGSAQKPVGTIYIAVSTPCGDVCAHYCWPLDRLGNKLLSAEAALRLLLERLSS